MQHKNKTAVGVAAPATAVSVSDVLTETYHTSPSISTVWRDCPNCGYKKSLSVTVKSGRLLFFCHAGCTQNDLSRIIRQSQPCVQPMATKVRRLANQSNQNYIQKLWNSSVPAQGTLVELYLRSRALTGLIPADIRFLSNHLHKPSGTHCPVMLARVIDVTGKLQAVHRTYLAHDGHGKADLEPSKMTLGAVGGFAVHLAPAGPRLAISEGIETGLSVQQATGIPAWAALSAGGIQNLILPPLPTAQEIIICADHDPVGQRCARVAAANFQKDGRTVRIALPPQGQDFNDILKGSA